jgi:nucleotide-binding universal stress UspA family protein
MLRIERILCPVDFSEASTKAYDYAYSLALRCRAKLFVEHVIPIFEFGYPFAAEAGIYSDLVKNDNREIEKLVTRRPAQGLAIQTDVRIGSVADSVLDFAQRQKVDLIVMGTHGRRGVDRLVMGSTTESVLRKARCPVLAVREPAHDFVNPDQAQDPVRLKKVILCTDFSECALAATDYALSLAQEYNAELTLLHVLDGLPKQKNGILIRETAQILRDLVPVDAQNWCSIKTAVRTGKPYREIIQFAAEQQADLVVLGVRGRNALDLAVFGSTAQRVLQLGPCPVLAVHMRPTAEAREFSSSERMYAQSTVR